MKSFQHVLICLGFSILFIQCTAENTESEFRPEITPSDIKNHITFLASDDLAGRETGTAGEAKAAGYIADQFDKFGLLPAGDESTYFQEFRVNMSVLNNPHRGDTSRSGVTFPDEERITRNVVAVLEGSEEPDSYLVLGAHYDHLGTGKFGSLYNRDTTSIHNGADDNASGTAGLLELAHYFSEHPTQRSLVFIAFSGEEMGLLGSRHFVENPTVPLDQTVAMINMDMIGRLNSNKLLIFGTGSSPGWDSLITKANTDTLDIETIPDGTGASDHTSFYNKEIPVLHYFTDTHADYHRPSDDTDYINAEGQDRVLEHVKRLIVAIDSRSDEVLPYSEAPVTQNRDVTMSGVTMGVTPDYGFSGKGMRITGVSGGGPADRAGLKSGDVIIRLADTELEDIYTYMEVLNTLEEGEQTTVTVLRDGEEQTIDIRF
ncbi:M28 family peptidase [Balneolaceae bacterium YR4-1]|uniref:M28 family peptidase n=1 Tax=Halalkalibaculum roseum TaxID=2709311 RepID=A0A6M1T3U0_9BACT|nr:M28 family peptidase [Halalkalibaculum roseum]NGP77407.1 M28 family peptidase [Halalkalibaculum roseum]